MSYAPKRGTVVLEDAEAEQAFRQSLASDPSCVPALYQLALLLELKWALPEAEALIQRLLAIDPADAEGWSRLGAIKLIHAQTDEALAALRRACELAPDADRHSVLLSSLQYAPDAEPRALLAAHRQWDERYARPLTTAARPHPPRPAIRPARSASS